MLTGEIISELRPAGFTQEKHIKYSLT